MNKPPCRMTIKDLLDQIDDWEARGKEDKGAQRPNQILSALISMDHAADLLDTDPETLRSELRTGREPGEPTPVPITFFRDLDIRL